MWHPVSLPQRCQARCPLPPQSRPSSPVALPGRAGPPVAVVAMDMNCQGGRPDARLSTGHAGGWQARDRDWRQQEPHWFADRMWLLPPEGVGGVGDKYVLQES